VASDLERYVSLLDSLKQDPPPTLLIRARGVLRVDNGEPVESVADALNLPRRYLLIWAESINNEGLHGWLGKPVPSPERLARARAGLAQMLVGTIAEEHFEDLSRNIVGDWARRSESRPFAARKVDHLRA